MKEGTNGLLFLISSAVFGGLGIVSAALKRISQSSLAADFLRPLRQRVIEVIFVSPAREEESKAPLENVASA